MTNEDLLAAATVAQEAGESEIRDLWLDELQARKQDNTETYWWLHAQRYLSIKPQQAIEEFSKAIEIQPTARALTSRAVLYVQEEQLAAAIEDLRQAKQLDPENYIIGSTLGFALWQQGEIEESIQLHEQATGAMPDDPILPRQLAYAYQRLNDEEQTLSYTRQVIDDLDTQSEIESLSLLQQQELFNFRRLHEDTSRHWTINLDSFIGLRSGSIGLANPAAGITPNKNYRSLMQLEAEYRLKHDLFFDGDLFSVYGRAFANAQDIDNTLPKENPMLALGMRWKPLRDYVFFLALEQQVPLSDRGQSSAMARASASFLNGGRFSDDWHPNGKGWFAQNLYLDTAYYRYKNAFAWTADYRASWHHKIFYSQTLEPYARIQTQGYRVGGVTEGGERAGVGLRWNLWAGASHYNAWPHKLNLGIEFQHSFTTRGNYLDRRNNVLVNFGVHW